MPADARCRATVRGPLGCGPMRRWIGRGSCYAEARRSPCAQAEGLGSMTDVSLEQAPGWSKSHVARLKEAWITTAEQVVAIGATPGGIGSLADQLSVPEGEVRSLVAAARAKLPPETRRELEREVDTSDFGMGV